MKKILLPLLFLALGCNNDNNNQSAYDGLTDTTFSKGTTSQDPNTNEIVDTQKELTDAKVEDLLKDIGHLASVYSVQDNPGAFILEVQEQYNIHKNSMDARMQHKFELIKKHLQKKGQWATNRLENDSSMGIVERTIMEKYAKHYAHFEL